MLRTCLACFVTFAIAAVSVADDSTAGGGWRIFAGVGSGVTNQQTGAEQLLDNVYGAEVDGDTILFSTVDDHSIWRMDPKRKTILRVAGTGSGGLTGDGGAAVKATFRAPHEIRVDERGNIYIADTRNHCIRWIEAATGHVRRLAGDGQPGFRGDGETGDRARFDQPHSIVLDGKGGLLVADTKNHRLRRIDLQTRIVTTVSGTGQGKLPRDGRLAKEVSLFGPRSLAIDDDSIWLVLREGNSVWRIDRTSGVIERVAGTGKKGQASGDGDPRQATFRGPKGIAVDSQGRLLIVDTENHVLRIIDRETGSVVTADIPFTMKRPHGTAVMRSSDGDLYLLTDSENDRVLALSVGSD